MGGGKEGRGGKRGGGGDGGWGGGGEGGGERGGGRGGGVQTTRACLLPSLLETSLPKQTSPPKAKAKEVTEKVSANINMLHMNLFYLNNYRASQKGILVLKIY